MQQAEAVALMQAKLREVVRRAAEILAGSI